MPKVNNNYINTPQGYYNTQMQSGQPYPQYGMPVELTIQDEFVNQHKKNGLFERLYNEIKNLTGLGTGSKKVQTAIKKAENGEITEDEAKATIDKYRKSQVNGAQAFGDLMSVGASGLTFFGIRKKLKLESAKAILNEQFYKNQGSDILNIPKKYNEKLCKLAKSKSKLMLLAVAGAALVGGFVKNGLLKINRIGSEEFKTDKKKYNGAKTPYDKTAYKFEKKTKRKERRRTNFRNFVSGAVNGLMMPISLLGGAIAGVPLYLAGNSLNRYFIGNREEKNKSFNSYIDNLKNDGITHAVLAAAIAVPMIKKGRYTAVFDKNLKNATDKLLKAELKDSGFNTRSTYDELQDILLDSDDIRKILWSSDDVSTQIQNLTKENIFAVKMKQIANDASPIAIALKENCPATRTLEEAQVYINNALGSGYKLEKCLGVGTIAETYLAKNKNGKDICIKVLKEGINKEKILSDKQKFINIIKNSGKSEDEIKYLLKNVDDLADGILKEVDFTNEMKAAQELAKSTKLAKVVKPIEVKNGVYIMEKADGISLASLIELNAAKNYKEFLEKPTFGGMMLDLPDTLERLLKGAADNKEKIERLNEYIKRIEARTPQFGDITLNKDDFIALIGEYQQVLTEQFNKVDKNGKVLHADIHPGNIFIDINALRKRKDNIITTAKGQLGIRKNNQIFTLIDTGNTINMGVDQSLRAIKLNAYVQNGNAKDLAEYVLDGAILGNKSKEEALKLVTEDLQKCFFDTNTRLEPMTNESLISMASNIMRKHGIVPSDTQLNFNKARTSAKNSLDELLKSLIMIMIKDINSVPDAMKCVADVSKEAVLLGNQYKKMQTRQEKLNLLQLTKDQILHQKKNKNMLPTNSEEHLIYKLKQDMKFNHKLEEI